MEDASAPERARDRTRALFSLVVGALLVLSGAVARWIESWSLDRGLVAGALVLCGSGALFLARPRRGQWLSLGLVPAVSALAIGIAFVGIASELLRPALLPAAISASGGAAVLAAFARWALAAGAHLHPALALDAKRRCSATRDGKLTRLEARELRRGDRVELEANDVVPVDGEIVSGEGFADERALTRASVAVAKGVGDPIVAGATTDIDLLVLDARASLAESLLVRVHARAVELLERIAHRGEGAGGTARS